VYDPFRIQFYTVSLDSEAALALIGVMLAGLAARAAARRVLGSPSAVWDATLEVAFWTIVGARLGWVVSHPEYYLRAPLQVFAVGDGGFLFGTGELAAAFLLWRYRGRLELSWPELGAIAGPAVAIALVLDRAGCALGACGAGQPTSVPWALVRSGVSLQPIGLYGVVVWLIAWAIVRRREAVTQIRHEWLVLSGALALERWVAWALGHESPDGLVVSIALFTFVSLSLWRNHVKFAVVAAA
jgi:prolipoprotein diacylglyceryltransferase